MLSASPTTDNTSVLIATVLCKGATGTEHSFSSPGVTAVNRGGGGGGMCYDSCFNGRF